jgi:hypothetical protein
MSGGDGGGPSGRLSAFRRKPYSFKGCDVAFMLIVWFLLVDLSDCILVDCCED